MLTEAWIEVAGWISKEPIFSVNKQGTPFCTFNITTTNNTQGDKDFLKFKCFCWAGLQYNLIRQLNLTYKDEVMLRGQFSYSERYDDNGELHHNNQVYVSYIKVIRSKAAEQAVSQLNASEGFTSIPSQQKVTERKSQMIEIDKNDDPF